MKEMNIQKNIHQKAFERIGEIQLIEDLYILESILFQLILFRHEILWMKKMNIQKNIHHEDL
jgi:hypothetical protein